MVGTVNMKSLINIKDAGIVNINFTNKALAMTMALYTVIDMVLTDPEQGCAMAVAEAARNIVCSGGEPSAITNCLNFGNPYNPEVYWHFVLFIMEFDNFMSKVDDNGQENVNSQPNPIEATNKSPFI